MRNNKRKYLISVPTENTPFYCIQAQGQINGTDLLIESDIEFSGEASATLLN